jgi:hypothetical protein
MAVDFTESPIEQLIEILLELVGATFAVKTAWTEIFYGAPRPGAPPDQLDDWFLWANDLHLTGITGGDVNSGSSSALITGKPVWVVSGYRDIPASSGASVILYSQDGKTWQPVFEQYPNAPAGEIYQFNPTGIVWDGDERAFFASFFITLYYPTGGGVDGGEPMLSDPGEEIYRSANGATWTRVSRNLREDMGAPNVAISDITPYCKKPENENRSGGTQKIPDGLQGYNKDTETFARPTSLVGFDPYGGARYDDTVQPSVTVIGKHHSGTRTVSAPCYAVAYFNNVWIAVGGGKPVGADRGGTYIDVSFDDGNTWKNIFQSPTTATFHGSTVSGQRSA